MKLKNSSSNITIFALICVLFFGAVFFIFSSGNNSKNNPTKAQKESDRQEIASSETKVEETPKTETTPSEVQPIDEKPKPQVTYRKYPNSVGLYEFELPSSWSLESKKINNFGLSSTECSESLGASGKCEYYSLKSNTQNLSGFVSNTYAFGRYKNIDDLESSSKKLYNNYFSGEFSFFYSLDEDTEEKLFEFGYGCLITNKLCFYIESKGTFIPKLENGMEQISNLVENIEIYDGI